MCVIAIAQKKALTADHVRKMFGANRDGAGIAWREHNRVQWRKGLDEDEMRDLCLTVPLPYIAHFRIASCGGVRPELTHPFPVTKDASLVLRGSTSGAVLFHNGHHHKWRDYLIQMALCGMKVPTGPWSDTRLMAFAAAQAGSHVLPLFEEKLVYFDMKDIEIFGTGWSDADDLVVSNKGWESYGNVYRGGGNIIDVCRYGQCKKKRVNGTTWCEDHPGGREVSYRDDESATRVVPGVTADPRSFRRGHNDAFGGNPQQETVEEVAESLRGNRAAGEEGGQKDDPALEDARKLHRWVRSLNPRTRRQVTPVLPDDEDYASMMM